MSFRRIIGCLILVGSVSSLVGCAGPKVVKSGFLVDYTGFEPSAHDENALVYWSNDHTLSEYDRLMIDPIVVYFHQDAKGVGVDPNELNELTAYMREAVVKAVGDQYRIVDQPARGVLRLRAALTDVKRTRPLLNIHPTTKLSGLGLGGASMEAELIDSVSNERVVAVVDSDYGDRMNIAEGLSKWGHAKAVMDGWASRLRQRLDEAHGVTEVD